MARVCLGIVRLHFAATDGNMTTPPTEPRPPPCDSRRDSKRQTAGIEHELFPNTASWLDLMPPNAGRASRFVFACLEYGVLEAWQDSEGTVRLYLPTSCGGHLIVGGPDDAPPPNLAECDPHREDPDALVRRAGAAWITLLPGIRRARTRPKPTVAATTKGEQEADKEP